MVQEKHLYSIKSKLTELPVEVLQDISSLLPLNSATTFTLCSNYTYEVLSNHYCNALRTEVKVEERKKFLKFLLRDLR